MTTWMTRVFFIIATAVFLVAAGTAPERPGAIEKGLASYYAGKFQGRRTANGEVFDTSELTAAHKTLPFNTVVRVTNDRNGLSVLVRINDRGPFVAGRVIDLSRAAAAAIEMVADGVVPVTVETVKLGDGATYHHTGGVDTDTVRLQVGSFRVRANAERAQETLREAGFESLLEGGPSGAVRVIVPGVNIRELSLVRLLLNQVGFPDILVQKTR